STGFSKSSTISPPPARRAIPANAITARNPLVLARMAPPSPENGTRSRRDHGTERRHRGQRRSSQSPAPRLRAREDSRRDPRGPPRRLFPFSEGAWYKGVGQVGPLPGAAALGRDSRSRLEFREHLHGLHVLPRDGFGNGIRNRRDSRVCARSTSAHGIRQSPALRQQ